MKLKKKMGGGGLSGGCDPRIEAIGKLILFYEIMPDVLITMTLSVSVAATQKEKQKYLSPGKIT